MAGLQLITDLSNKLSSAPGSIVGIVIFEKEHLGVHTVRDAVREAIKPVLGVDEASDWGAMRKAILEAHINSSDPATIAAVSEVVGKIRSWRTRQAIEFLLPDKAEIIDENNWERAFYRFTQQDGQVAALWGWVVKGEYKHEVEARFGKAVPESGYDYYVTQTHVGSLAEAKQVFRKTETVAFIEGTCEKLGH